MPNARRVRISEADHPPARLDIIGGGVIGRMAAHIALDSPYFRDNIHMYDKTPVGNLENASVTSLAQVLPLATEGDESHRKKQFEVIRPLMKESLTFYRKLAQRPRETGVKEAYLVDLVQDETDWPEPLVQIMRPTLCELDKAVELTGADGIKEKYRYCYVRPSAQTVHGATFLNYLSRENKRFGVQEYIKTITPSDLWRMSQLGGVTLQAVGMGATKLSGEPFVNDWGASIRNPEYEPDTPREIIMRGVGDIALSATAKGLIGGGGLWTDKPSWRELDFHKYRLQELGRATFTIIERGDRVEIEPMEEHVLANMSDLKIHRRPTSDGGIFIGKAWNVPNGVIATGMGHAGMSVAPGAAREIIWRAEEEQQNRCDNECKNSRCEHWLIRPSYLNSRKFFQEMYPDYNWS